MINKHDFTKMRETLSQADEQREQIILLSREIIKASKQVIYSIQRKENDAAKKHAEALTKKYTEMHTLGKKKARLDAVGAYKVAAQEYVEAVAYLAYVEGNEIPTHEQIHVDAEYYLMGMCDLTGELVREAINAGIREEFDRIVTIKEFVSNLYGEFIQFDFRGGELRKKFDSIKYDLQKLENMMYELKVQGKI